MTFFKKILPLVFLIGTACSVSSVADAPNPPTLPPSSDNKIDASPEAQARFKTEWLAATAGKVYSGSPDLFGGGSFGNLDFAFDSEGCLHYQYPLFGGGDYTAAFRIVSFYSGTQAVVMLYKNATTSAALRQEVYALEVRDNKIYRTQNVIGQKAMGFSSYKDWDKASYSDQYLKEIAAFNAAEPYPALTPADPNS